MYCTDCGTLLPEMARYCPSCGRPAATEASSSIPSGPASGTSYRAATGERILPANAGDPLRRTEPAAPTPRSSLLRDFLVFRTMITPVIILLVFWIGGGLCSLVGLGLILGAPFAAFAGKEPMSTLLLTGFAVLILGPLVVRLFCEQLILFFRMNETLTEIKHVLERRGREE